MIKTKKIHFCGYQLDAGLIVQKTEIPSVLKKHLYLWLDYNGTYFFFFCPQKKKKKRLSSKMVVMVYLAHFLSLGVWSKHGVLWFPVNNLGLYCRSSEITLVEGKFFEIDLLGIFVIVVVDYLWPLSKND